MQERTAYICLARLAEGPRYFLWLSVTDDAAPDGVAVDADGSVPVFTSESAARSHAASSGLPVAPDAPHIYDLVRLAAWCEAPAATPVDCEAVLNAWNLFTDLGPAPAGVASLYSHSERAAKHLYDKLFFANNLSAMTPAGESYAPDWDASELVDLSAILRRGLLQFTSRLRVSTV